MRAGRRTRWLESLGVDRKTLRKYIAPAEAAGIVPGGPAKSEEEWAGLVRGWFPQLADTRLRQVTWPAISEHHDYIVAQLKAGVRMSTIHQRLRDERGLAVSVQSFRRYVAANVPEETRRSQVGCGTRARPRPGSRRRSITGSWAAGWTRLTGKLRTVLGVRDGAGLLAAHVRVFEFSMTLEEGPARAGPRTPWRLFSGGVPPGRRAGKCGGQHFPGYVPGRIM